MEERYQLFTTLISKCARLVKRIKSNEMSGMNMKSSYVSCLYYLYINDKAMTAKELCEVCEEDKAYVSRSMDALEKGGYIVCASKREKRYNSPISLTEKGVEVAKEIAGRIDRIVETASMGLTEENRKIFYASLGLICKNLERICEKYGEGEK